MFDRSMENSSSYCVTIMMINDNIDGMLPRDENFKSFPLFYLSIHFHAENQFKSFFTFHLSIHFQFYEGRQSLILIYNYWQNKGRYCSLALQ